MGRERGGRVEEGFQRMVITVFIVSQRVLETFEWTWWFDWWW